MGGRDKIYIVGSRLLKPLHFLCKAARGVYLALSASAYGLVLAKDSFQGTACEKYGAAASFGVGAADAGLLPFVQHGARHSHFGALSAGTSGSIPVCPALSGAHTAV